MSGIIVDRAVLHLQSQSAEFRPGDTITTVIFEIAASGFKVRIKSGRLKSMDPPMIQGKSEEESHIFKVEEDARRYYREKIELLEQVGFHQSASRS